MLQEIFGDVIHSYTRQDALDDGTLIDVSKIAREAGFKVPVAIKDTVHNMITPTEEEKSFGQDYEGRLWDIFSCLKMSIRINSNRRIIKFYFLMQEKNPGSKRMTMDRKYLKAIIGPGDNHETVLTIMLPNED